jgi:hypothetical protein
LYGSAGGALMRIDSLDGSYSTIIASNYPTYEGLAFVPVPSAVILGSLGLTFSGWILRKRRML